MQRNFAVAAIFLFVVCTSLPVEGQFQNVLSTLFGGNSSPGATPASTETSNPTPTATPSTTPAATPRATPAAEAASPVAEAASPSTSPKPTPASTLAATTRATPAAAAAPKAESAAREAAAPEAAAPEEEETAAPAAAPVAKPTPRATPAKPSPPPPAPPIPITIDATKLVPALPADQTVLAPSSAPPSSGGSAGNSSQTAADLVLRVSGSGVTPFLIPQQTVLLRAMASVLTTVSLADLQIRYVTSSVNMRRRLLEETELRQAGRSLLENDTAQATAAANGLLYNVAAVTLQANCSDSNAALATMTEMQSVMSNNLLSSAFQAYGQPSWGASLLSLTSVDPRVALNTRPSCKKSLGSLCLDNSSLSVAAAEVIIAIGCLFIIVLVAVPCVWLEWHRKTGQMAELDPTPDTPRTPLDKVQQFYNNLVSKAKAASPLHRRAGSNGRNAFKSDSPTAPRSTVQLTATS